MLTSRVDRIGWRPKRRLWLGLAAFVVASVGLNALADWRETHALLINRSTSLPNWAFLVRMRAVPTRDNYITFIPPARPLVIRHFGAAREPWNKIVYGVAGDRVTHIGSWVRVNGRVVGHMKPRSRAGEPLTPGVTGAIPAGCYYVGTPHPDGFDSRYADIGFVCGRQIVGVAEPIL